MQIRHRAAVVTAVAGIALTGIATATPALAATAGSSVQAGSGSNVKTFTTEGTVSGVDATKGTVTVTDATGKSTVVSVSPKALVTVDGKLTVVAKLPLGAGITLSGNVTDGGISLATKVSAASVLPFATAGSVVSADDAKRTVTVKRLSLTTAGGFATDVIPVADKALITLDGKVTGLGKLTSGATVVVTGVTTNGVSSAKTLTALSRWDLNLSGAVTAVDVKSGTITVSTGPSAKPLTLKVDPKATVTINGKSVSLADLPVGASVKLSGSETTVGTSVLGITANVAATSTKK
ncbi:hypothetical protein [Actinoplanes rectilineatus]|uniref:hypothetical protein n=1 Tax=Actinoplanes rectilineatus TaxID=113571 RepID=UPI0005F2B96F|nr:hypothetical protein [Actinoplanes rectilineatus]